MRFKIKIALLVSVFISGIITGSYAQTAIKSITAQINTNIKIMLNGNQFDMKDSKGKVLSPIIYNDLYYLPILSIGNAANLAVDFDKKTQTIILGERAGKGVSLFDLSYDKINKHFEITKDPKQLTYNKIIYKIGMYSQFNNGNIEFTNLNKRFQKLYFKAWVIGEKPINLKVTADKYSGKEIFFKTLNSTDGIIDIDVTVQGINGVCFTSETEQSKIYIVEAYLK